MILLVEGEVGARGRVVAGGLGETEVGMRRRVGGDAGVGGVEEEGEEGEGSNGYGTK